MIASCKRPKFQVLKLLEIAKMVKVVLKVRV
jgi:hypothetical protein